MSHSFEWVVNSLTAREVVVSLARNAAHAHIVRYCKRPSTCTSTTTCTNTGFQDSGYMTSTVSQNNTNDYMLSECSKTKTASYEKNQMIS